MKKLIILSLMMASVLQAQPQGQAPAIPVITDVVKQTEVVPTMPVTGNVFSVPWDWTKALVMLRRSNMGNLLLYDGMDDKVEWIIKEGLIKGYHKLVGLYI